jgi:hypothetical protein
VIQWRQIVRLASNVRARLRRSCRLPPLSRAPSNRLMTWWGSHDKMTSSNWIRNFGTCLRNRVTCRVLQLVLNKQFTWKVPVWLSCGP